MTITDYISYACIALFIIYWVTLNFFSSNKTSNIEGRPKVMPYSFFKQSEKKITKKEAKEMIDKQ